MLENLIYDDEYQGPRWVYGLRNRPPMIGAVPKGRIVGADKDRTPETDPRFRFGTIEYDRELSAEEIYDYELITAGKIESNIPATLYAGPDYNAAEAHCLANHAPHCECA